MPDGNDLMWSLSVPISTNQVEAILQHCSLETPPDIGFLGAHLSLTPRLCHAPNGDLFWSTDACPPGRFHGVAAFNGAPEKSAFQDVLEFVGSISAQLAELKGQRPLPAHVDNRILKLVLAVSENSDLLRVEPKLRTAIVRLRSQLSAHLPESPLYKELTVIDELPLRLCEALLSGGIADQADIVGRLQYVLGHESSNVRLYYYKVVWLMRSSLPAEPLLGVLHENLAWTLGFVTEAAGLLHSLYPSGQAFFEAAQAFEPRSELYREQYFDRIDALRRNPNSLNAARQYFESMEEQVRSAEPLLARRARAITPVARSA